MKVEVAKTHCKVIHGLGIFYKKVRNASPKECLSPLVVYTNEHLIKYIWMKKILFVAYKCSSHSLVIFGFPNITRLTFLPWKVTKDKNHLMNDIKRFWRAQNKYLTWLQAVQITLSCLIALSSKGELYYEKCNLYRTSFMSPESVKNTACVGQEFNKTG